MALGGLVLPVLGQAPTPDNAGYGCSYVDIALDPATGSPLNLGVAVDFADGHVFVSATGVGIGVLHQIHEFDPKGQWLGSFPQPVAQQASAFGIRDMAHDGASFIGVSDIGVSVFDRAGLPVQSLQAAAGPSTFNQPIQGAALALLGTMQAVAFDPAGDAGRGSLFVASDLSDILEIDLSGSILASIPNRGWTIYGLAYDPRIGALWVSSGVGGEVVEIDRATAQPTGRVLPAVGEPGSSPGGLSVASPAAGHHEPWQSELLLAQVRQGPPGPDRLVIQRVDLHPGLDGTTEAVLRGSVVGDPLESHIVHFATTDTFRFVVEAGRPGQVGMPCWTIVNFFFDANRDAYTDLGLIFPSGGYLAEWRTLSNFSVPSTSTSVEAPHGIGTEVLLSVPTSLQLFDDQLLRFQSLYLEPASPTIFSVTNELNFVVDDGERGIVVAASGPNSFQGDPTRSFWSVHSDTTHTHGDILWLEMSFSGAALPAGALRFDLDQNGMLDRFDGGNSTQVGCQGTYRNGSDVACGLDYAAAGVYVDPTCHVQPGESAGFVAGIVPGFVSDAHTLRFRFTTFTPGSAFLFDCDTDGGLPSGDAHAGMSVTIATSGSGLLQGELQVDPAQPDRASLFFP